MLLNDLPDECLWLIFDNFFELEELIQLSKVCSKWSNLIDIRLKKVKYLLNKETVSHSDYSKVWMENPETIESYNLRRLLPNLRILDIFPYINGGPRRSSNYKQIVNNNPKVKGLIGLVGLVFKYNIDLKVIRMVSMNTQFYYTFEYKKLFRPNQLQQIRYNGVFNLKELSELVQYFPNLKRLNITLQGKHVRYNGPNLSNLKIFESSVDGWSSICNAIHVIDFCPSLESAYIHGQSDDEFINMTQKNYNLRDLVIVILFKESITWAFLRRLLSKYPNLQNLAIRGGDTIEDNLVEELVKLLPKIKLLDFRRSQKVTQKSADFLSKFYLESNRLIKIYFNCEREPTDWPKLNTPNDQIFYGFDFMKHCFYKSFSTLPDLIDE
ncbi:uncharacterized protein LOC128386377 [Panonychus citri]|uniref:uncharacterized protein LOC128386377 n=1 Tax=Panonychus citri TaxID=50023 RepID=UPI00230739BF|nr:uncharacterized protein LOC128386377 [Panonychus citri]